MLLFHEVMPRPIWKGAISFGLVTVPVGLYAATERAAEVRFRLLHAKDGSPIDYKRVCEAEGVEVPWEQIVRGYEHAKGQYVALTDQDLARARVEATQTFAIQDFVPARAIDVLHYDQPYYLAPTSKAASKAYALLREALAESGRVGIGTLVLRQREHLAALAPSGRVLALTTLRYAYEIRSTDSLDVPAATRTDKRELTLARQLIDTLARDWDPTRYRDTYRDVVLKVIEQKAKGAPVAPPARRKPAPVVDLMEALRRSLAEPRRAPATATGRRGGRRPGRRPGRRAA